MYLSPAVGDVRTTQEVFRMQAPGAIARQRATRCRAIRAGRTMEARSGSPAATVIGAPRRDQRPQGRLKFQRRRHVVPIPRGQILTGALRRDRYATADEDAEGVDESSRRRDVLSP